MVTNEVGWFQQAGVTGLEQGTGVRARLAHRQGSNKELSIDGSKNQRRTTIQCQQDALLLNCPCSLWV